MAHNSINGAPCHSSASLMTWLRQQGNGMFDKAFLASDMCDVGLLRSFRVTRDLVGSVALAMGNGLDQELCNPTDGRGMAFPYASQAVASGALPQGWPIHRTPPPRNGDRSLTLSQLPWIVLVRTYCEPNLRPACLTAALSTMAVVLPYWTARHTAH